MNLQADDPDAHRLISALSTTFRKVSRKAIHEHNQEGILTSTTELYLFGGVDLKSSPDFRSDQSVAELDRAVQQKLKQEDNPRIEVSYGGATFAGIVLPLTQEAVVRRKKANLFVKNGNVYRLDSQGRLAEMVDSLGNRSRYIDPAMGVTGGVKIDGAGGWHAIEQKIKNGIALKLTTARGNLIDVVSDSIGAVENIAVDGKPWAQIHKQASGGSVRFNQGNYTEVITFDSSGRTTGYQIERPGGPGKTELESAKLEYNPNGHLTRISGTGIPDTELQYDQAGHLQKISSSNGTSVLVSLDERAGRSTLEERVGPVGSDSRNQAVASLTLENGRVLSSDSPDTGRVEYKYNDGRLVDVSSERLGETSYSYDKYGRPAVANLPSGAEVHYNFAAKQNQNVNGVSAYEIQIREPQSIQKKSSPVIPQSYSQTRIITQS
jgi:YD repeat-containing protein